MTVARQGVQAFFDWWLGELADMVPRALKPGTRRARRCLILAREPGAVALIQAGRDGEKVLGRVADDDPDQIDVLRSLLRKARRRRQRLILRLGPEQGLRKVLDLPLAARDDLDQLFRLEMDRLTPFNADQVFFAYRIITTDRAAKRIQVELQVAPKPVVEAGLAIAGRLGVSIDEVELAPRGDQAGAALNLLPRESGSPGRGQKLNRFLALLALVLTIAAVVIPLQQRRSTAVRLAAELARAKAEAEETLALREELERLSANATFLVNEKRRTPLAGEILAELTRIVPDQAYVVQLQLRDGQVLLHGFAETASDLIELLEDSPLFQAPQFRSPVTRDPRTDLERFQLSVEIARETS